MNARNHYTFTLPKWLVWAYLVYFAVARYPDIEDGALAILRDLGVVS